MGDGGGWHGAPALSWAPFEDSLEVQLFLPEASFALEDGCNSLEDGGLLFQRLLCLLAVFAPKRTHPTLPSDPHVVPSNVGLSSPSHPDFLNTCSLGGKATGPWPPWRGPQGRGHMSGPLPFVGWQDAHSQLLLQRHPTSHTCSAPLSAFETQEGVGDSGMVGSISVEFHIFLGAQLECLSSCACASGCVTGVACACVGGEGVCVPV